MFKPSLLNRYKPLMTPIKNSEILFERFSFSNCNCHFAVCATSAKGSRGSGDGDDDGLLYKNYFKYRKKKREK